MLTAASLAASEGSAISMSYTGNASAFNRLFP
jgi:hypothetical protein